MENGSQNSSFWETVWKRCEDDVGGQLFGLLTSYKMTVTWLLATFKISCELQTTQNVYWSRTSVCLSLATFPHYCTDPDETWGMVGVPSSCALLGGFVIGARVSLPRQHSANAHIIHILFCHLQYAAVRSLYRQSVINLSSSSSVHQREMSASACTRCVPGLTAMLTRSRTVHWY